MLKRCRCRGEVQRVQTCRGADVPRCRYEYDGGSTSKVQMIMEEEEEPGYFGSG